MTLLKVEISTSATGGRSAASAHTTPPTERAPHENDTARVNVVSSGQCVVRGHKDFGDAGLGWRPLGPSVAGVFHKQDGESQTSESRHFADPVVDEFSVAVGDDDRRSRACLGFGPEQPGFRSTGARFQPDAFDSRHIRSGAGRDPDQVSRKYEAALCEEKDGAVEDVERQAAEEDPDQDVEFGIHIFTKAKKAPEGNSPGLF